MRVSGVDILIVGGFLGVMGALVWGSSKLALRDEFRRGSIILGAKTELVPKMDPSRMPIRLFCWLCFWVGYFCLGGPAIKGTQDSQD